MRHMGNTVRTTGGCWHITQGGVPYGKKTQANGPAQEEERPACREAGAPA